jgi:hypothetical protein
MLSRAVWLISFVTLLVSWVLVEVLVEKFSLTSRNGRVDILNLGAHLHTFPRDSQARNHEASVSRAIGTGRMSAS